MSKTTAQKNTRSKTTGPLEVAWNLGRQKESPTGSKDDREEESITKKDLHGLFKEFQEKFTDVLKEEIITLRDDFQKQLDTLGAAVQQVDERTAACEVEVKATGGALQTLQESLLEVKKQNDFLFSKCEDLENRDRRRNIRLRGVPEKVEGPNMIEWATDFLHNLQPDLSREELALERAHRVGPIVSGAAGRQRDILLKFYNFQAKEKILQTTRNVDKIYCEETEIWAFQDIAQSTLQRRAGMRPITTALREKEIKYRWLYPFGLSFEWNKKQRNISSMEEGRKFLPAEMCGGGESTRSRENERAEGIPWPWQTAGPRRARMRRRNDQPAQEREGEQSEQTE